jgi:hypothetical protein
MPDAAHAIGRAAGQNEHGVGQASGAQAASHGSDERPPLDDVNERFHTAYGEARRTAEEDAPVFVLLPDSLVVFAASGRRELPVRPRSFHVIKAVSHAPVALFALLWAHAGTRAPSAPLEGLARCIEEAKSELSGDDGLAAATRADLEALLARTGHFIAALQAGEAQPAERVSFAIDVGPLLLRLATDATRLQLATLHAAVEDALASFDSEARARLHVVVTGDHQARERSLGMQYFQKRLGEETAGCEERVSYAEAAALALVGTRRLDRALARAFFGDERRLQRDVLGDAAEAILAGTELTPVGRAGLLAPG